MSMVNDKHCYGDTFNNAPVCPFCKHAAKTLYERLPPSLSGGKRKYAKRAVYCPGCGRAWVPPGAGRPPVGPKRDATPREEGIEKLRGWVSHFFPSRYVEARRYAEMATEQEFAAFFAKYEQALKEFETNQKPDNGEQNENTS